MVISPVFEEERVVGSEAVVEPETSSVQIVEDVVLPVYCDANWLPEVVLEAETVVLG